MIILPVDVSRIQTRYFFLTDMTHVSSHNLSGRSRDRLSKLSNYETTIAPRSLRPRLAFFLTCTVLEELRVLIFRNK